jgi:metallophosphoesterase (TIGR00282 family)
LNTLFVGDIVGSTGRKILKNSLKNIKRDYKIDIVIANGENAAGGKGITLSTYKEIIESGVDLITMGNHIWDKKDIFNFIEDSKIIRPLNYPPGTPGRGSYILKKNNTSIGVINASGRIYLDCLDCPFRAVDKEIEKIKDKTDIIILDFHGEATSEKTAMGYYLDGRVSAVIGTHTHVQTADERILPKGTGYITDAGMTGPYNSILGVGVDIIISKFIHQIPQKFEIAEGQGQLNGVVLYFDPKNRLTKIERLFLKDNLD